MTMPLHIKSFLLLCIALFIIGCSTNKVVVERRTASPIMLSQEASIEVQSLQGQNPEEFLFSLNQILMDRTPYKIIHTQSRNELIDSRTEINRIIRRQI